ncbi:MAG: hypothetical protein WCJ60_01065 [bacterium]
MYKPSLVVNSKLRLVAGLIEKIVPNYNIKQSDPVLAAETGSGNCVSKAVIGAIVLDFAKLVGPVPALTWNTHTHPKIGEDMFGRTKVQNGHAQLLVAGTSDVLNIQAMSFNPSGTEANHWEVYDFNDDEKYAEVKDNHIQSTESGKEVGFEINDWYIGGKKYNEAIGTHDSVYHLLSKDQMSQNVISLLKISDFIISLS